MRMKLVALGLLFFIFSQPIFADVPVDDINEPQAEASPFVDTPDQEFVQRQESAAQNAKPPAVLLSKIEALEKEIQELRGKLEVQAHDLKLLNDQQQAFYKDMDSRLTKLAGRPSSPSSLLSSAPTKMVAEPKKIPNEINETPHENVATKKNEESLDLPTSDAKGGEGEQSYNAAYQLIKHKQYTEAISAFEAFLIAYPGSSYLPNANYWLGELYLMQNRNDQAIQAFTRVVKQFPKSNKAAGAQLKIGFAYYDKGQYNEAREALQRVTTKYPDTSSAHLATERLQAMGSH